MSRAGILFPSLRDNFTSRYHQFLRLLHVIKQQQQKMGKNSCHTHIEAVSQDKATEHTYPPPHGFVTV